MNSPAQSRAAAGIPSGGQFLAQNHGEADFGLAPNIAVRLTSIATALVALVDDESPNPQEIARMLPHLPPGRAAELFSRIERAQNFHFEFLVDGGELAQDHDFEPPILVPGDPDVQDLVGHERFTCLEPGDLPGELENTGTDWDALGEEMADRWRDRAMEHARYAAMQDAAEALTDAAAGVAA